MLKLGLLGRDIQHSKSKSMYEKIFAQNVDYELLDYATDVSIPSLSEIFSKLQGLSITAPYKKHFLKELVMAEDIRKLDAVNCIRVENEQFYGTNTDYSALSEIFLESRYQDYEIIMLGSGSMANITEVFLNSKNLDYQIVSRKTDGDITKINISLLKKTDKKTLVINACARSYSFMGKLPLDSVFWDYNYSHEGNRSYVSKIAKYIDGTELLYRQAVHATKFWNLIP